MDIRTSKKKLFAGWRLPPDVLFIGTALIVGVATGIGAVMFRYLIKGVEWVGYDWFPMVFPQLGTANVLIIPAIGGLIVGPMIYFFAREAKGHGVPEVMEAVALKGGRIRPIVAVIKSLASSISIGSGGSVGREGPIVQIGSAIGSTLGQRLRLSDDRIRNLVACGAAGGIAATFNAPIAGVLFALEIIVGKFSVEYFSSVVISAVAASVIGRAVFGDVPSFAIPIEYGINSFWEFLLYPLLAIIAAGAGFLFVRVLYWSEDVFAKWKSIPEWLQPMIGGLLLGGMGLAYPIITGVTWTRMPQVFNVGYNMIESALASQLTLTVVLTLFVLKLIATSLTLGSGGSGGVFAPSLFMGAMLGTAFEIVANNIFPGIAPPGAYALVGMAAMFAATAHAPITAVLILFELTGDYRIILPMMLTVVIATILAQLLLKGESIYTLKLTRRGVRLERGRDLDIMHGVQVEEIMSHEVNTITKDATLKQLSEVFNRLKRHGLVVLDERGKLWGMVTISDLERALSDNKPAGTTRVENIAVKSDQLLVAFPDQSMGEALALMAKIGIGRMPVVSREDKRHLVGWIRREDILGAYNLALTRRAEIQQHAKEMQVRNVDGTEFTELALVANDRAVGKEVHEFANKLPKDCVLIAIRRDGRVLIPHGNTVLKEGDLITAFVQSDQVEVLYDCFKSSSDEAVPE